jgi:hypothetical protein
VAGAETRNRNTCEELARFLPVVGKEEVKLEDAFRMICVAMHDVTLMSMLRTPGSGSLRQVREPPRKGREKQGNNEQYARDDAW